MRKNRFHYYALGILIGHIWITILDSASEFVKILILVCWWFFWAYIWDKYFEEQEVEENEER